MPHGDAGAKVAAETISFVPSSLSWSDDDGPFVGSGYLVLGSTSGGVSCCARGASGSEFQKEIEDQLDQALFDRLGRNKIHPQ